MNICQQPHNAGLKLVGILILVHKDVLPLGRNVSPDMLLLLEKPDRVDQEIIIIHQVVTALMLLVQTSNLVHVRGVLGKMRISLFQDVSNGLTSADGPAYNFRDGPRLWETFQIFR